MHKVRIKKSDDVCVNCICFFPVEGMRDEKIDTPIGQCRRRCPQIVWHFPEKDIATGFPFVAVNGTCMEGMRKDGKFESFLARAIYNNLPESKRGSKK